MFEVFLTLWDGKRVGARFLEATPPKVDQIIVVYHESRPVRARVKRVNGWQIEAVAQ